MSPSRSWQDLLDDAGDHKGGFEVLPEGDYDMAVKEATATLAKSSGARMWVLKAEVQGGPHDKRLVWHNLVLTEANPAALGFFFRHMNCLGLTKDYFAQNPSDHHVAEALVGRRFRAQLAVTKYQGQDKNEIKQFFPPAGAGVGAPPQVTAPPVPAQAPPPPAPPAPPAPSFAAPAVTAATPPPPPPPAPPAVVQAPTPEVVAETAAEQITPPPPPALPPVEMVGAAAASVSADSPGAPPF